MAFSLAVIILFGLTADYAARRLKIPGLVGMLLAGVIWLAPRLLGMSTLDAAILGAILAAVSPAVVVPMMIDFMDRGRGTRKGIPTLVLAASSIDDVFVIVVFTILLGAHGGEAGNLWLKLAEIPVSVLLGVAVGLIPGYLLYRLFTRYDFRPPKRTIVVIGTAIAITWLESAVAKWVPVASLIGVMASGGLCPQGHRPGRHRRPAARRRSGGRGNHPGRGRAIDPADRPPGRGRHRPAGGALA
jgi:NhaP-type Na+/H+ or K+/H+ antiporter